MLIIIYLVWVTFYQLEKKPFSGYERWASSQVKGIARNIKRKWFYTNLVCVAGNLFAKKRVNITILQPLQKTSGSKGVIFCRWRVLITYCFSVNFTFEQTLRESNIIEGHFIFWNYRRPILILSRSVLTKSRPTIWLGRKNWRWWNCCGSRRMQNWSTKVSERSCSRRILDLWDDRARTSWEISTRNLSW